MFNIITGELENDNYWDNGATLWDTTPSRPVETYTGYTVTGNNFGYNYQ